MSADLARRMADNQIATALRDLARDAQRLAESAAIYAHDAPTAALHGDGARRLVNDATNLLLQAARLDGMRQHDAFVPGVSESAPA